MEEFNKSLKGWFKVNDAQWENLLALRQRASGAIWNVKIADLVELGWGCPLEGAFPSPSGMTELSRLLLRA